MSSNCYARSNNISHEQDSGPTVGAAPSSLQSSHPLQPKQTNRVNLSPVRPPSSHSLVRSDDVLSPLFLGSATLAISASHLLGASSLLARLVSDGSLGLLQSTFNLVLEMGLSLVMSRWGSLLDSRPRDALLLGAHLAAGGCLALAFGGG